MKIIKTTYGIENFKPWSGAGYAYNAIIRNDKEAEFNAIIADLYPEGIDETQLNDLLWFDRDWVYEILGLDENGDPIEDDDDDEYNEEG
jgi:hypothetical protein